MVVILFVCRCVRAVWRGCWAQMQVWGYIMAKAYLPDDETQEMVDPELRENLNSRGIS